jgi:hypothetical protein
MLRERMGPVTQPEIIYYLFFFFYIQGPHGECGCGDIHSCPSVRDIYGSNPLLLDIVEDRHKSPGDKLQVFSSKKYFFPWRTVVCW